MTAADLASALRRFWWLALGIFLLVLVLGTAAALLPKERFESSAGLLVAPVSEEGLSFGAAEAVQYLLPPVARRVGSESFQAAVRRNLPPELAGSDLSLIAENEPGTGILTVRAESTSKAVPQRAGQEATALLIEDPGSRLVRVSVLDPAGPATSTTAERRLPLIAGSLVLGLIAGLLSAVAAHMLVRRLPGPEQLSERFNLNVLGSIPASGELPPTAAALFQGEGPPEVVEAFRRLEANFQVLARPKSVVAVTSWVEGEGKTTVAANLAWALASLGRQVTAVDCDLRQPGLHRALGVEGEQGVADIARVVKPRPRGEAAGATPLRRATALDSLQVIAAGKPDRHPVELVNAALPIITNLQGTVIVDTPPMVAAETTLIATKVDAVIVVIDARRRNPAELEETLRELRLSGATVLGVVINRASVSRARRSSNYLYAGQVAHPQPAPEEPKGDAAPPEKPEERAAKSPAASLFGGGGRAASESEGGQGS